MSIAISDMSIAADCLILLIYASKSLLKSGLFSTLHNLDKQSAMLADPFLYTTTY